MKNTDTPHPLYLAALKADEHYSKTISTQFPGKTRWTLTKEENSHPEIDAAYRAKVSADKAWLDWMEAMRADVPLHEAGKPLFRSYFKRGGKEWSGPVRQLEAHAETDCRDEIAAGATFAAILRDSQGADHPDNAGKFFLHRYVKA